MKKGIILFLIASKGKKGWPGKELLWLLNNELLTMYWEIGYAILLQQKEEGWGTKVIDRLATDLKTGFPDLVGFAVRNFKYMRAFAEAYPQFVQQPAAQLLWGGDIINA